MMNGGYVGTRSPLTDGVKVSRVIIVGEVRIGTPPAGRTKVVLANVVAGTVLEGTVPMPSWVGVTVVVLNPMVLLGLSPFGVTVVVLNARLLLGLIQLVLLGLTVVVWTTALLRLMVPVFAGLTAIFAPADPFPPCTPWP